MKTIGIIITSLALMVATFGYIWGQGIAPLKDEVTENRENIQIIEGSTVRVEAYNRENDRFEKRLIRIEDKIDASYQKVLQAVADCQKRQ